MVEVAGVEPASLVLSQAVSTCLDINLLSLPERLRSGYPVSRFSKIRRVIENQITRYTVEVAGVEPASCGVFMQASTSLVGSYKFSPEVLASDLLTPEHRLRFH